MRCDSWNARQMLLQLPATHRVLLIMAVASLPIHLSHCCVVLPDAEMVKVA